MLSTLMCRITYLNVPRVSGIRTYDELRANLRADVRGFQNTPSSFADKSLIPTTSTMSTRANTSVAQMNTYLVRIYLISFGYFQAIAHPRGPPWRWNALKSVTTPRIL